MQNDPAQAENSVLLQVENLKTYFFLTDGIAKAVDEMFGKENVETFKDTSWLVRLKDLR